MPMTRLNPVRGLNPALIAACLSLGLAACETTSAAGVDETLTTSSIEVKERVSGYPGADRYVRLIEKHARANEVPIDLALAVVGIESSYNAKARGAAGEIGLMQLKPATARMMGFRGSTSDLYDPETNIKYGMKYLGKARELGGGDTCGTILRYNAGHGATRMNPISKRYCGKVQAFLK